MTSASPPGHRTRSLARLAFALAVSVSSAGAQQFSPDEVADASDWAQTIERAKPRLREVTRMPVSKESRRDMGADVIRYFYRGDSLLKVEATDELPNGRITHHFYVRGRVPRVLIVRHSDYGGSAGRVVGQRVEYGWFSDHALLAWRTADGATDPGDEPRARTRGEQALRLFAVLLESAGRR
jgi:hypothetical protein